MPWRGPFKCLIFNVGPHTWERQSLYWERALLVSLMVSSPLTAMMLCVLRCPHLGSLLFWLCLFGWEKRRPSLTGPHSVFVMAIWRLEWTGPSAGCKWHRLGLKLNGSLAKLGLTLFVKWTTGIIVEGCFNIKMLYLYYIIDIFKMGSWNHIGLPGNMLIKDVARERSTPSDGNGIDSNHWPIISCETPNHFEC